MKDLMVELSTAEGRVFAASVTSIDLRTGDGTIVNITPQLENYVSTTDASEITLQTADGPCVFVLENAVAGLKGRTFTVLAESIRRVEPDAFAAPAA